MVLHETLSEKFCLYFCSKSLNFFVLKIGSSLNSKGNIDFLSRLFHKMFVPSREDRNFGGFAILTAFSQKFLPSKKLNKIREIFFCPRKFPTFKVLSQGKGFGKKHYTVQSPISLWKSPICKLYFENFITDSVGHH